MKSEERWPVIFEIVQYSDSVLGEIFNLYFITAVSNKEQLETMLDGITFQCKVQIEEDKFVATSLCTQKKLEDLMEYFHPRAKKWRGQYQSVSKAVVSACEKVFN